MLNFNAIRTPLVKGLRAFTEYPVIMADQTSEPPAYPYYTMKFTTVGEPVGQQIESTNEGEVTFEQVTEMTVSLTAYSDKLEQSFDCIYKALEFFKGFGIYVLQDENIVIVRTHPITNRDTFLNVEYERRHGFDIDLRIKTVSTYDVGFIERLEFDVTD